MFKMTLLSRLAALGASVALTFSVVAVIADYGLPSDGAGQMLVQRTTTTIVK